MKVKYVACQSIVCCRSLSTSTHIRAERLAPVNGAIQYYVYKLRPRLIALSPGHESWNKDKAGQCEKLRKYSQFAYFYMQMYTICIVQSL